MQKRPILVIGATGKTGRRVASRLDAAGHPVRRGSRQSHPPFDWENQSTWAPALAGASAAYITFFPDLAFPGAPEKIKTLTDFAAAAGVGRLVLLSGRGETHAQICEGIVRTCGLDYTLLRASWFAQNFSEGYLHGSVMEGVLAMPAGDVAEPFVDIDDIAEVAVAALTDPRHSRKEYDVTGPRLLTFQQAAAELGQATGRSVVYQPISLDQFHAAMTVIGGPMVADVFTNVCRETLDGHNATLGDGVQRALGRPARDFADFCAAAAASGIWAKAA
jgi:uncharacterized protein YbjT (DUF2867 family)